MTKGLIILLLTSLISSNTFSQSSSYQRIVNKLIELNREYPEHSRMFTLGHNDQNIPIQGIQISSEAHSLQALNQSQHLIVGTHHGNERAAPELTLKSARLLLEQISLDLF